MDSPVASIVAAGPLMLLALESSIVASFFSVTIAGLLGQGLYAQQCRFSLQVSFAVLHRLIGYAGHFCRHMAIPLISAQEGMKYPDLR